MEHTDYWRYTCTLKLKMMNDHFIKFFILHLHMYLQLYLQHGGIAVVFWYD